MQNSDRNDEDSEEGDSEKIHSDEDEFDDGLELRNVETADGVVVWLHFYLGVAIDRSG